MFELIRRLKVKIKKISNSEGKLVLQKFYKEFPRIARTLDDVNKIAEQGLSNEYMFF